MMAGGNKKVNKRAIPGMELDDELKKEVKKILTLFHSDEAAKEFTFSNQLPKEARAFIHKIAPSFSMKSKSKGYGTNRKITVVKNEGIPKDKNFLLGLSSISTQKAEELLSKYPLTLSELEDVYPVPKQTTVNYNSGSIPHIGCLFRYNCAIPKAVKNDSFLSFRKQLPIWSHQEKILNLINNNQVVLVVGDTGSGKTTQIPQFILEDHADKHKPVRIICTQPRRIAAISVAERVATERGEKLGHTVGYQIRLENCVSPKTLLTFCTTGVLLRTMMFQDKNLDKVTHIIIDEIHERDRFCDFLLGVVRSKLRFLNNTRIILMSASLDVKLFTKYFENCSVCHVEGRCYPVQQFFLEDVLKLTNYKGIISKNKIDKNDKGNSLNGNLQSFSLPSMNCQLDNSIAVECKEKFDFLIEDVFVHNNEASCSAMLAEIAEKRMPVDYKHSVTLLTPLMAAAGRGHMEVVKKLIRYGADASQKNNGLSASDIARRFNCVDVAEFLSECEKHPRDFPFGVEHEDEESEQTKSLIRTYKQQWNDEEVNIDLILDIIHYIVRQRVEGAILVFLPGYDEIVTIRDQLQCEEWFVRTGKFEVYILHSNMQSKDQRRVFQRLPKGYRKIILSTNIAETSITIDDVAFVIDSGKIKVKSYDTLTGVSSLLAEWISKTSALQRKGRAGRCRHGFCFHLFSRSQYSLFQTYQTPEILRVPLEDLCLQSKMLAPANVSIAEFISQIPEAPCLSVIKRTVQRLQWMDALDQWENVTDLGRLLLELPIEPRLGKMLLTATVLRCLDPILNIICSLTYKDPFSLPAEAYERKIATQRKAELAVGCLSDHMILLRAFKLWQIAKEEGREIEFCQHYFLSSSTMEIISQLRIHILEQLRKSGFVRSWEELNRNSSNWPAIKASIVTGLYPHVAYVNPSSRLLATHREPRVRLHPTSILLRDLANNSSGFQKEVISNLPTDWLVYEELTRLRGLTPSVRCCTVVSPVTLAIFAGHIRLPPDCMRAVDLQDSDSDADSDDEEFSTEDQHDDLPEETLTEFTQEFGALDLSNALSADLGGTNGFPKIRKQPKEKPKIMEFAIDNFIRFLIKKESSTCLLQLRQKWQSLFVRRMRDPSQTEMPGDDQIIDSLLQVLAYEEEASALPLPPDITSAPINPGHRIQTSYEKRKNWTTKKIDNFKSSHSQFNIPVDVDQRKKTTNQNTYTSTSQENHNTKVLVKRQKTAPTYGRTEPVHQMKKDTSSKIDENANQAKQTMKMLTNTVKTSLESSGKSNAVHSGKDKSIPFQKKKTSHRKSRGKANGEHAVPLQHS